MFCTAVVVGDPVSASGGISCSAEDKAASFELMAGVTHGMGSPVFSFTGELQILDAAVAEDLRKQVFEQGNLAQYWLDGEELRLLLYREREADKLFGSVELTVRARTRGDEDAGVYEGTYGLAVFDMGESGTGEGRELNFSGDVSCFVE